MSGQSPFLFGIAGTAIRGRRCKSFFVMWYVPAANEAFWTVVYSLSDLLHIDRYLAQTGWWQFRFWRH